MMGIYVNGIEMPKEPDEMIELAIFGDGKTVKTGESWRSPVDGKCYYGPSEDMNTYSALTVLPHGRLIDADALINEFKILQSGREIFGMELDSSFLSSGQELSTEWYCIEDAIEDAPTIIEAEEW